MEEDLFEQEDEAIEEEMSTEEAKPKKVKKQVTEEVPEEVNETWEAFSTKPRMGLTNTLTGEVIEGFDPERDEALVLALKRQFNMLDKIAISTGS